MLLLAVFTSRYNLICEATQIIAHDHKLCSSIQTFLQEFAISTIAISVWDILNIPQYRSVHLRFCGSTFNSRNVRVIIEMPLENQIKLGICFLRKDFMTVKVVDLIELQYLKVAKHPFGQFI